MHRRAQLRGANTKADALGRRVSYPLCVVVFFRAWFEEEKGKGGDEMYVKCTFSRASKIGVIDCSLGFGGT